MSTQETGAVAGAEAIRAPLRKATVRALEESETAVATSDLIAADCVAALLLSSLVSPRCHVRYRFANKPFVYMCMHIHMRLQLSAAVRVGDQGTRSGRGLSRGT